MSYVYYNPSPAKRNVGDCAVRAVSKALNISWESAYAALCIEGYIMCDLPNSNACWGAYLARHGFQKQFLPTSCIDEYTVQDFINDHPDGTFVLALSGHVVCVEDGQLWDSWDSSQEIILYYFEKRKGE